MQFIFPGSCHPERTREGSGSLGTSARSFGVPQDDNSTITGAVTSARLDASSAAGMVNHNPMLNLSKSIVLLSLLIALLAAAPATENAGLRDPAKKEIAMQLVSAAENSSLDWKAQYGYIEYNVEHNEKENRGYTAGVIG